MLYKYPDNYLRKNTPLLDPEMGYILKSSSDDISSDHSICFNPEDSNYQKYAIQLNSEEVDINSFSVKYIESTYENYIIVADMNAEPVYWYEEVVSYLTRRSIDRSLFLLKV